MLVSPKGVGADVLGFHQVEVIDAWIPPFLFSVLFGLSTATTCSCCPGSESISTRPTTKRSRWPMGCGVARLVAAVANTATPGATFDELLDGYGLFSGNDVRPASRRRVSIT